MLVFCVSKLFFQIGEINPEYEGEDLLMMKKFFVLD